MAIFLEFFVLGNNHTLQDPLYTRSITLILCIERNKKNQISNKLNLQVCKLKARQTQTKQVFGKSTGTCAQHYSGVFWNFSIKRHNVLGVTIMNRNWSPHQKSQSPYVNAWSYAQFCYKSLKDTCKQSEKTYQVS